MNEQTREYRIRLVLLAGQALFRASLSRFLASEPSLEVVGECGGSAEALDILRASKVDIVLLDFDQAMDDTEGFMSAARRNGYQGRFLIVAGEADARDSALAIRLGASGVFLKSEAPDRLVQAIALVANGAAWLDQRMIHLLADQSIDRLPQREGRRSTRPNLLTDREQRVILGILGGLTNKKIGEKLGISEGSVKSSVQQLFHRTGVRTRSQLVRAALEGSLEIANELTRRTRNATSPADPPSSDVQRRPAPYNPPALHQPDS